MYAIEYQKPKSLADAAALLAKSGGKALAGGQSLVAAMKLRLAQPGTLVDLGAIPDLKGIRKDGDAIVIGAMTRHAEIAASADVKRAIPALASLAEGIGDRQVRNMGTLGGSIAQQRSGRRLAGRGGCAQRHGRHEQAHGSPPVTSSRVCTRRRSVRTKSSSACRFPYRRKRHTRSFPTRRRASRWSASSSRSWPTAACASR